MYKLVVLCSVLAMAAAKASVVAPLAYSAVPAVSSVSQYSGSVVHGVTPGVYSAPWYGAPAVYGASVYSAPAVVAPSVLSQAPHSPAVVLDAVRGVPLDTPEVVAARAAHYQAKSLAGVHHLRKRSVPVAYSSVVSPVAHSAYVSPVGYPGYSAYSAYASPVVTSPLAYSAAVVPSAYSVHPW